MRVNSGSTWTIGGSSHPGPPTATAGPRASAELVLLNKQHKGGFDVVVSPLLEAAPPGAHKKVRGAGENDNKKSTITSRART